MPWRSHGCWLGSSETHRCQYSLYERTGWLHDCFLWHSNWIWPMLWIIIIWNCVWSTETPIPVQSRYLWKWYKNTYPAYNTTSASDEVKGERCCCYFSSSPGRLRYGKVRFCFWEIRGQKNNLVWLYISSSEIFSAAFIWKRLVYKQIIDCHHQIQRE